MERGVRRTEVWSGIRVAAVVWPVLLAGCPGVVVPPDGDGGDGGDVVDGNRDDTVTSPLGKTFGEPNGTFAEPVVAVFDSAGNARLEGTVSVEGDLDVFLLGSMSAGDRLVVDAYAYGSSLDVTVAVFDDQERLVFNNDDREPFAGGSLDALVDFVIRHSAERYYVVVSNSPFGSARRRVGAYRVDLRAKGGFEPPAPVAQTLVLDFDGAVVDSPVLGAMTLGPFDAAAISVVYEGRTAEIKESIRNVVEQNYERFDVLVLTSDDPPPAAGTMFTTVYFGGFSDSVFGIAENVDLYNADYCDDAIIFAESFVPGVFSRTPSAENLGVAIGNVAAHEAGHLLGLNHTDDDLDLMDDQSPADAFLADQEFKSAPLSDDIMPIGVQDGVLLLEEIVGPSEAP